MTDNSEKQPANVPEKAPPPKPIPPSTVSIRDGEGIKVLVRIK